MAKRKEKIEVAEVSATVGEVAEVSAATSNDFLVTCNVPNFYIGSHLIVDVVPKEVLENERLNKILQNALRTGVIKKA